MPCTDAERTREQCHESISGNIVRRICPLIRACRVSSTGSRRRLLLCRSCPTGSIYDPDVVYVDPVPTGPIYYERMPARTLGGARERYTHEYQGGGQGDYYLGITPPAPVP